MKQFHIPGDAGDGSGSVTTGPGAFPWAPEVTRPETDGSRTGELPSEENRAEQQPDIPTEPDQEGYSADAKRGRVDDKPWNTTISVPPSKAVRDGVCFRGLCVLLFVVEEEQQQAVVRNRAPGSCLFPCTPLAFPERLAFHEYSKGTECCKFSSVANIGRIFSVRLRVVPEPRSCVYSVQATRVLSNTEKCRLGAWC